MTYEYLCTACEHVWEAEQSISEAPLKTCPRCKKDAAKRQVSGGAGFILKGGGWYADLYGSSSKKSADASGDAASGDAKKPSETKKSETSSTDSGSAAKDASKSSSSSDGGSKGGTSGSGNKGGADSSAA